MWPDGVVVNPPTFGQDPDLLHRVEDLAVEELVTQLRVEALAVSVFPRAARLDVECLCTCVLRV